MKKEGLKDKPSIVRHRRATYLSLVAVFAMVIAAFTVICYSEGSEAVPGSYEDPYTWTSENSVSLDGGANFDKSLADIFDDPDGAYRTDLHPTITLKAGYYNTTVDRVIGGKHYTGSGLVIMHPLSIQGAVDGEGNPATILYADFANSGSSGFSFWKDDGVSPNELIFTKTSNVSLNNLKLMPMVYFGHKYASDTSNASYRLLDVSNSDPAWFTPNCTITSMSTADGDAKSVFVMDNIEVVKADTGLMHTPAVNNDAGGTEWTGGNTMYMMEDGGNCQFFAGNVAGYGSYTNFDITISNFKSCGGLSFSKIYATETGSKKSSVSLTNIDIDVPGSNSTDRTHDGGDARGIKKSANTDFDNTNVVINILGRNSINTNDDLNRNIPNSVVNIKNDLELTADFTINDDVVFNIADGKTLTVPNGCTITNNGTINGNVVGVGTGTITGAGTLNNPAVMTTLPVANNLTYSGEAQALVTEGAANTGTVKYSLSLGGPWTTTVPTGTDAGQYVVYYMVDAGDDPFHSDLPASADRTVNVTIAKGANSYTTAPAAIADLVYNGNAQVLITAGVPAHGTIQYKLGTGEYGADVPTATNAGTYTVYVKVIGDDNWADIAESSITVTIAKANVTISLVDKLDGVCGSENRIGAATISPDAASSGTVTYKYYSDPLCTAEVSLDTLKVAGTYYAKAFIADQTNYNAATSAAAKLVVKHDLSEVAASGKVAKHWDCSVCHKHFLDENGTIEYTLPTDEDEQTIIDTTAVVSNEDSSKATADATATITAVDAVKAADPEAKVVAEISTSSTSVTTVAVQASQVKTLADKGADVKVSNTTSSAEFTSETLKAMTLTSGDFEFQAKTTAVPDKYKEKLGSDAVAVDLKLNVGGTAVKQFGEKVKVTVAYDLPDGADASKLKVYYVGGDVLEEFECTYDATAKTITFETSHFSEFAVGFDNSSSSSGNNQGLLLAVLLVSAIIAPIIVALVVFRKK